MEERKINYDSLVSVLKSINDTSLSLVLLKACEQENLEICRACIDAGVNVNRTFKTYDSDYYSPILMRLLEKNNLTLPVAKFLVENGANLNANCPLSIACYNGDVSIVKYFLEKNAAISYTDTGWNDYCTLSQAIRSPKTSSVEILKILFDLDVHKKTNKGYINHAFVYCFNTYYDPYEKVKFLLENGLSPNTSNWDCSVLHQAVLFKKTETVRLLLENGADVNAIWTNHNLHLPQKSVTALDIAKYKNYENIISILEEFGGKTAEWVR